MRRRIDSVDPTGAMVFADLAEHREGGVLVFTFSEFLTFSREFCPLRRTLITFERLRGVRVGIPG
jgi:hypothetical protein